MENFNTYDHIVHSEILIIGGGIAGLLAAVSSSEFMQDIVMVSKGKIGWSGATACCGGNAMTICFPEDDAEMWMQKYVENSDYTVDQQWVQIFIEQSYKKAMWLDGLGKQYGKMIFPHHPDKEDEFWRIERTGNPCTIFNLPQAQDTLRREIEKRKLRTYERISIVQVLCHDNRVYGAIGINYRNGETYLFQAKAVVLAAGACTYQQDLFEVCGEGFSLAYHAGAKMMSFDRGGAISRPRTVMHNGTLFSSTANSSGYQMGGRMINRLGEDFFQNMTPEMRKAGRIGQNMAIKREIEEGRGPIYEDYTNVSDYTKEVMKSMRIAQWKRVKSEYNLDPFTELICVADGVEQTYTPDHSNRMGGVAIDHHNQASVDGLFVVGDNSAPVLAMQHPFGGCELGWAVLSGSLVGESVNQYLMQSEQEQPSDDWYVQAGQARLESLFAYLQKDNGKKPDEVKANILKTMIPYDVVHSDAEHLQAAIEKIAKLRNEDLLNMKAWDYHELREAIEVESMLDVSEMILRSEYMRKESRVGVRRKDYPMMDNVNWLKWVVLQKNKSQMALAQETIPTPYKKAPQTIEAPAQHRV